MQNKKEEFLNLKSLIMTIVDNWRIFACSIALCLIFGFVYIKITKPIYRVNANVLVKSDDSGNPYEAASKMSGFNFAFQGSMDVEDELFVISSYSVVKQAVKDLELNKSLFKVNMLRTNQIYEEYPLTLNLDDEAKIDTLSAYFLFDIKISKDGKSKVSLKINKDDKLHFKFDKFPIVIDTDYARFTIKNTKFLSFKKSSHYRIALGNVNVCTENLMKSLNVRLVNKNANVISLSMNNENKERGQSILDKVIAIYNADAIRDKNIMAVNTSAFISDRLGLISSELAEIEEEAEVYKKENAFIDIAIESQFAITKKDEIKNKILELSYNIELVDFITDFLNDEKNKFSMIPVSSLHNESLNSSFYSHNKVILDRLKTIQTTHESNPYINNLNIQLEALRGNIKIGINNYKANLQTKLSELENEQQSNLTDIKYIPTKEREYININRKRIIKEQLFLFLMERQEENSLKLASSSPKAKIIDQAYSEHKPVSPKKMIIMLLSLFMGGVLPMAYFYIMSIIKDTFASVEELKSITNIPVLGEVCRNKSDSKVVVAKGDNSSIVELFKLIRVNLQFVLRKKEQKVVLLTSTVSGEGKSFIALNISLSLALASKRVVLIGLDIRNPRIGQYIGATMKENGVTNFLSSETMTIEDVIQSSTLNENLDCIISGPIPPNPSELLQSERLEKFFEMLRERYDYIIVDSAPVGMVSDTFMLEKYTDATLYICRANYSKKSNIEYAESLFNTGKIRNISFIINATETKSGYGYGYGKNK